MVVNGALGSPKEVALSFALIVHVTLYFPITIWGAIEWYRQNLSMKQVRAAEIEGNGRFIPPRRRTDAGPPHCSAAAPTGDRWTFFTRSCSASCRG